MSKRGRAAAVDMSVSLGPVALPNPIVAASGTYGHADEVARQGDVSAIGAVTSKSVSPFPWSGNPPPRVHETAAGMLNSVGLENPGASVWVARELPRLHATGARVIASIWGRTVDDYAQAAAMIAGAAPMLTALEVNVSCPNLEDRSRMFAHSAAATKAVIDAAVRHAGGLAVFAKLSPNVTDVREIAAAALDGGATGLTLINTLLGLAIDPHTRRARLGAGGGGLSGPAIKPIALRIVSDVARAFPAVPIIGTGGVATALDAVEMLLAGASAVGVGTASFRDPRAPQRIARDLACWCDANDVARVRDLIGGMQP